MTLPFGRAIYSPHMRLSGSPAHSSRYYIRFKDPPLILSVSGKNLTWITVCEIQVFLILRTKHLYRKVS
jgi:hypothetical protein